MPIDPDAESLQLRTALRDLVALSTIPAAWVGREPPAIAAGLADVLVGSLHLDFAFVRLCDPNGGAAVDITRGTRGKHFRNGCNVTLPPSASFRARKLSRTSATAWSGAAVSSFPSVSMPTVVWSLPHVIARTFPPKSTSCSSPWPRITPRRHSRVHASSMSAAVRRKSSAKPATTRDEGGGADRRIAAERGLFG